MVRGQVIVSAAVAVGLLLLLALAFLSGMAYGQSKTKPASDVVRVRICDPKDPNIFTRC